MAPNFWSYLALSLLLCLITASPAPRALTAYAPVSVACPATPLVRPATAVGAAEQQYYTCRYTKAQAGLKSWLSSLNASFAPQTYPAVALTTSGGGYRSLLAGAGVIQGFDKRDSNTGVSGVLQGLTYQAGLSGGSWLLSSLAANNFPTVTSLKTGLWEQAFQDSLLLPQNLLSATAYTQITADIVSKQAAGFPPTLTDPWGRLLSYQLLYGPDGGVSTTMSSITSLSSFASCDMPFPIITALGVKTQQSECLPGPNATQYEFSPFEFGSWDDGVRAFTPTAYLGSALSNGQPANGTCTKNYDNQGYILGTSSSLFNEVCVSNPSIPPTTGTTQLTSALTTILNAAHALTTRDLYAVYPNPFRNLSSSPLVSSSRELSLVDGGEALQNNPVWPILHRPDISVLLVNDNSADTPDNFPNGSEILTTYVQARDAGSGLAASRMPPIPPVDVFVARGLNKRPTFFGCNLTQALTVVYLPNVNYTFASNQPTSKLQYTKAETDAMVANGVQVASQGGDAAWPVCLACGIMKKSGGALDPRCDACFQKYCYN